MNEGALSKVTYRLKGLPSGVVATGLVLETSQLNVGVGECAALAVVLNEGAKRAGGGLGLSEPLL